MKYHVVTVGSATVDLFARMTKRFSEPKPGDKVLLDFIDIEVGGGGVNPAIALSRMGLRTAFLGKLGSDHNADEIVRTLVMEGVELLNQKISKLKTAFSIILTSKKEADRILYTYKGASNDLGYDEVDERALANTDWIYLATMLGKSFKTAEKIAQFAKQNGINLLFNTSLYLASMGASYLSKILEAASVLILNREEAAVLLDKRQSTPVRTLLNGLAALGPRICIVTDGARGVHAFDGGCYYFMKPYRVKVVSTAGAGDAFNSGLLAGLIRTSSLETAIKVGMANAASVIKYWGTKNRLLSWSEALQFIRKHTESVLKTVCQ